MTSAPRHTRVALATVVCLTALAITVGFAPAGAPQNAPRAASARAGALIDITGQWVSVVTEDWRWRMMTLPKGDTASVPLESRRAQGGRCRDVAADRARGDLCKGVRSSPPWSASPDASASGGRTTTPCCSSSTPGMQTRRFHFDPRPPATRSVQGHSQAEPWFC